MGFKSYFRIRGFCCLYLHNLNLITQASFGAILRIVTRQESKENTFFRTKNLRTIHSLESRGVNDQVKVFLTWFELWRYHHLSNYG